MMLPLLLALQQPTPQRDVDTFPLQPSFIDVMPAGKAIVNRTDSVSFRFQAEADTAIAVYKDGRFLVRLRNSLPPEAPLPDPTDTPLWQGEGIKVIFVGRRVSAENGAIVEAVGVVRE
jgi:hypothetical protein